jgi:hypothetical protein
LKADLTACPNVSAFLVRAYYCTVLENGRI